MDAEKDAIIYQLKSKVHELETENKAYKKSSDIARKNEFRAAGIILLAVGAVTSVAAYLTFGYSSMANVLLMVGVGSLFLGAIVVSMNTERFMNQKIAQHLNLSSVIVLDAFLRDLRLTHNGIYIPSSRTSGGIKIFIPLENAYELPQDAILKEDRAFLVGLPNAAQEGVLLEPLGYHLFRYAKDELKVKWGGPEAATEAQASDDRDEPSPLMSLDRVLKDTLVEGLELADTVTVTYDDAILRVQLHDTPYIAVCRSIMRDAAQVCRQIGCPVCSLITCIFTEYVDREVVIKSVQSAGGDIILVCRAS